MNSIRWTFRALAATAGKTRRSHVAATLMAAPLAVSVSAGAEVNRVFYVDVKHGDDGNIVVAPNADEAIRKSLLRNGGQLFERPEELLLNDPKKLDFTPKEGSPAIDNGVKIPGFNDDTRGAPDIGPFELGRDIGPAWPRPRKTAFNVNPPELISGKRQLPKIWIFGQMRSDNDRRFADGTELTNREKGVRLSAWTKETFAVLSDSSHSVAAKTTTQTDYQSEA